jgi:hypothetical protein
MLAGHGQHRLNCIAAFGKDRSAILDGGCVRGGNHAATMPGRVKRHAEAMSSRPRFFKSASTVGRRPRNDV